MSESPVTRQFPVTQPPLTQAPGRYRIDVGRSTVTFVTRHLFGLAPVRGTFALRDGTVIVADPLAGSTVRASVAASSFQSGNPVRDAVVLSTKMLGAEAYPSLTFTATSLEPADLEPADGDGGSGQWRLRGELWVRGVAVPVEAHVTAGAADPAGTTLRASARLSVDRYAFGLTAFRGLAARQLTVDLDIVAHRDEAVGETV